MSKVLSSGVTGQTMNARSGLSCIDLCIRIS